MKKTTVMVGAIVLGSVMGSWAGNAAVMDYKASCSLQCSNKISDRVKYKLHCGKSLVRCGRIGPVGPVFPPTTPQIIPNS